MPADIYSRKEDNLANLKVFGNDSKCFDKLSQAITFYLRFFNIASIEMSSSIKGQ